MARLAAEPVLQRSVRWCTRGGEPGSGACPTEKPTKRNPQLCFRSGGSLRSACLESAKKKPEVVIGHVPPPRRILAGRRPPPGPDVGLAWVKRCCPFVLPGEGLFAGIIWRPSERAGRKSSIANRRHTRVLLFAGFLYLAQAITIVLSWRARPPYNDHPHSKPGTYARKNLRPC